MNACIFRIRDQLNILKYILRAASLYLPLFSNISQPQNCSESIFFLRVKDKYAALWPFVGIVAEVVVLCIVIFACEHGKNKKEEFDDDGPNGNGVSQSGAAGNSNVRQRRT